MSKTAVVEKHEVVVVGAGMSGIGTVIRLQRDLGIDDVVVLERGPDVGGTWLHNTYTGCACDVPSSLYASDKPPHLRAVGRNPELRRQLTPEWTLGCKRITFSNRFYQSLQRRTST